MSAKHPNSLWTKIRRGRHGKMRDIGGEAWNRTLMEGGENLLSADYLARFRHLHTTKGRVYYRGAFIRMSN